MKITRRFDGGQSPYATIPFRRATSEIEPDGSVVFASTVSACGAFSGCRRHPGQKYFRKAGVRGT
jgi:hypothetical protein